MAFDDVTIFEVNLPQEPFKSEREDETGTEAPERDEATDESEDGGRPKLALALVALVLAGVALGVRKLRSGDDEDVEMEYESPGVEVETES